MSDLTAAQAEKEIKQDDHRRAMAALAEEQRKLVGAKERAKKQQARFDKAVALAVSSRPKLEEWYAYPGPLSQDDIRSAVGLKPDELHALMKRFRR